MTNTSIETVIKKSLELCQEKIPNNALLIETSDELYKNANYLKAGLPINKFLHTEKMHTWELLKMPKTPGTYVIEGIDRINENYAKAIYGWALNGKASGVRAILVTKTTPEYMLNKIERITY
jgi:hypothetical protein